MPLVYEIPFAIIIGMTLKMDKAGRIVLPKPVRQRFHLNAGANLELAETPEGLLLRPVTPRPALVKKNGLLMHRGKAPRNFDWERMVDDLRQERIRDVGGL
jgi:AbrB family looped-hinge helix DNA binding protein